MLECKIRPGTWPAETLRLRTVPTVGDTASRTRRVRAEDIELFTELTATATRCTTTGRRGALALRPDHRAGRRHSGLLNAVVAEDLPARAVSSCTWTGPSRRRSPPGTRSPPRSRCSRRARTSDLEAPHDDHEQEGTIVLDGTRSYGPSRSSARPRPRARDPGRGARPAMTTWFSASAVVAQSAPTGGCRTPPPRG